MARRGPAQVFLAGLIVQQVAALVSSLNASGDNAIAQVLRSGYLTAYTSGALWSLLNLLGRPAPHPNRAPDPTDLSAHLERLALEAGISFDLRHAEARDRLERQVRLASQRLLEHRAITGGQPSGAETRAGVYGVRWGVQQGVSDVGTYSSAVSADGQPQEFFKTWVRLAQRAEHRSWHDALEGGTILFSQKFRLVGPNGVFLVDRPYDPILPLSETIRCGHGLRVTPPDDAAVVRVWDGSITNVPTRRTEQLPRLDESRLPVDRRVPRDEVLRGQTPAEVVGRIRRALAGQYRSPVARVKLRLVDTDAKAKAIEKRWVARAQRERLDQRRAVLFPDVPRAQHFYGEIAIFSSTVQDLRGSVYERARGAKTINHELWHAIRKDYGTYRKGVRGGKPTHLCLVITHISDSLVPNH